MPFVLRIIGDKYFFVKQVHFFNVKAGGTRSKCCNLKDSAYD